MNAWVREPALRMEREWDRFGKGGDYEAWNKWSPELAFCEMVGAMVALARPRLVIETGVGQGFITRRILRALPRGARFVGFEADPLWRPRVAAHLRQLSKDPSPGVDLLSTADVVVLDSHPPDRQVELAGWLAEGKAGSLCIVHDVIPGRTGLKGELAAMVEGWGVLTPNPRGGWVGRHP